MTAPRTYGRISALLRRLIYRMEGAGIGCASSPAEPGSNPDRATEPSRGANPFGPHLTELRCALACFDLVDEVVRADSAGMTEANRQALAYAEWSLAGAARRASRAYTEEVDRGT